MNLKEMTKTTDLIERLLPEEIERRSFEMIARELGTIELEPLQEPIIKRCIHASADFDYVKNLVFSENAVPHALEALRSGVSIVTDTKMAMSGINQRLLHQFGGQVYNFISDEDVAVCAKERGVTRSAICMEKAAALGGPFIFAIGNAPTALIRLKELIDEGKVAPSLVIGVPVGFVNVEISKELIMQAEAPYIVARGRKGGSNIAAAICNALLYMLRDGIAG